MQSILMRQRKNTTIAWDHLWQKIIKNSKSQRILENSKLLCWIEGKLKVEKVKILDKIRIQLDPMIVKFILLTLQYIKAKDTMKK